MDKDIRTGSIEMTAAMLISGTIGWFVLMSGQPVIDVVFWRCLFGALTLLAICAMLGHFRAGILTWRLFTAGRPRRRRHRRQLAAAVRRLCALVHLDRHHGL